MVLDRRLSKSSTTHRKPQRTRVRIKRRELPERKRRRNAGISFKRKIYGLSSLIVLLYIASVCVLLNKQRDPPKHALRDYLKRVRRGGNKKKLGSDLELPGVHHEPVPEKNRTDFRINELPRHCDSSLNFTEIIIKGERHSGTNWVRAIMEKNVEKGVKANQTSLDIGWKHGFLPPLGWGKPIEENELLLVVTRDVFTWLPKMFSMTYDPDMDNKRKKMRFSDFIRTDYTARCHPLPQDKKYAKQSHYQVPFCHSFAPNTWVQNLFYSPGKVIAEKASNLVQIRTQKYKQWLSGDPSDDTFEGSREKFLQQRMHISLENLTSHERKDVIGNGLTARCVPVYKDFEDVIERTKWKGYKTKIWAGKKFDSQKEKQKLLGRYSKSDLRYVLSQLDLEFEKQLGYNYDYVYELLERDDIPDITAKKKRPKHSKGQKRTNMKDPRTR